MLTPGTPRNEAYTRWIEKLEVTTEDGYDDLFQIGCLGLCKAARQIGGGTRWPFPPMPTA